MKEIKYIITDDAGIHARPAGLLVKEAEKFKSEIMIAKGEKNADAKRLFSVMSLGVKKGDEVTVTINGEDEAKAISAIESFMKKTL